MVTAWFCHCHFVRNPTELPSPSRKILDENHTIVDSMWVNLEGNSETATLPHFYLAFKLEKNNR